MRRICCCYSDLSIAVLVARGIGFTRGIGFGVPVINTSAPTRIDNSVCTHCFRCQAQVEWVLRCYDDRFQATERKPDFYLDFDPGGKKIGEIVFRVSDPSPQETSAVGSASDENDRAMHVKYSWMWKVSRQVLVIRTPYWPGRHVAADPSEFLPIIDFLQYMHEKGFIHGDIRCFNIVFNGDKGKLIDFDYSGRAEVTKYPRGYQFSIPDGTRKSREDTRKRKEIGSEERDAYDAVPKWHDWYALGQVILNLHRFTRNGSKDNTLFAKYFEAREMLSDLKSDPDADRFVATLVEFLKACANAGWGCASDGSLATKLKGQTFPTRCNLGK
jgi:hypothetical protein